MGHYKDGKPDGLQISWHKNGQKKGEGTIKDYKDGKKVSGKYWNRKGEEVGSPEEAERSESASEESNSLSETTSITRPTNRNHLAGGQHCLIRDK